MNEPSNEQVVRSRAEAAAQMICEKSAGRTWEWINEKSLRIWDANGAPFMTLHIEVVQ